MRDAHLAGASTILSRPHNKGSLLGRLLGQAVGQATELGRMQAELERLGQEGLQHCTTNETIHRLLIANRQARAEPSPSSMPGQGKACPSSMPGQGRALSLLHARPGQSPLPPPCQARAKPVPKGPLTAASIQTNPTATLPQRINRLSIADSPDLNPSLT